jgi:AcrR family transcriptional regulator
MLRAAMARPRLHDPDELLDAAQAIVARGGPAALTTRALAAASGAPSGTIYHAFGSREALLARVVQRAAATFLDALRAAIAAEDEPDAAVVAAALTPLRFAASDPDAAAVLLVRQPRQDAASGADLTAVLIDLARRRWGRRDRAAVQAIRVCVIDLPTGLVLPYLSRGTAPPPATQQRLDAAVRAVLALDP